MYPFSEFDLPDEMKPRAGAEPETLCTTALAPWFLGTLLEDLLQEVQAEKAEKTHKPVQESAAR